MFKGETRRLSRHLSRLWHVEKGRDQEERGAVGVWSLRWAEGLVYLEQVKMRIPAVSTREHG